METSRRAGVAICSFIVLMIGLESSLSASLLYEADFTGSVGFEHSDSSTPAAGPQSISGSNFTLSYQVTPSTDGTLNFFRTNGTVLESQDFGGAHTFEGVAIDISGIDVVDIEWVGGTSGSEPFNAASEFFEWFYRLGMDSPVGEQTKAEGELNYTVSGLDVSAYSELWVGVRARVDGAGDGFDLNSITVTGSVSSESPVPEPGAAVLCLVAMSCLAVSGGVKRARSIGADAVIWHR